MRTEPRGIFFRKNGRMQTQDPNFQAVQIRRMIRWITALCIALLACLFQAQAQSPTIITNVNSGCAPLGVQCSTSANVSGSLLWDFGVTGTTNDTSSSPNAGWLYSISGTYTITLTVNSGVQTSSSTRQIVVSPSPVSVDFSVSSLSGCQGQQVFNFTNSSVGYDSSVWYFGDGNISYQDSPVHVYDTSGVFNVELIVFNSISGCSKSLKRLAYITVHPSPTAVVTALDTMSCDQSHVFQFDLSSVQHAQSFEWNFGDGSAALAGSTSMSYVYGDTGSFDVSVTMVSALGCSATIARSALVDVMYNPVPVFTSSVQSGCEPLSVVFNASAPGQPVFTWTFDTASVRTGSQVNHVFSDSGTYQVELTTAYLNGCIQTINAGVIEVEDKPDFDFSITNHTGCAPLLVSFTNQSSTAPFSWHWDFGDGDSSLLANPLPHNYPNQGVYQVYLTAIGPNGCSDTDTARFKVTVLKPVAAFAADLSSGCAPLDVNFNNQSTSATHYMWNFGDGTTSTSASPSHTYVQNGSYSVTLIAIDSINGCSDTISYNNLIQVSSLQTNYQAPDTVFACAPYAVNFSDASGASTYAWDFGDGNTSSDPNPYHVYQSPGVFTVSLVTTQGNSGCAQSIPQFQTFVIDGAQPGFTYTVSQCPPYVVQFTDTSLNATSWSWNFGFGQGSTLQHPTHTFPNPGVYNVTLVATTASGCSTTLQANGAVQISGLGAFASFITADTVAPFNVQFYANSTNATWWLWDFGDGTTDTTENPQHTFTGSGPFHIMLTIGNDSCSHTYDYPPISFGSAAGTPGGLGGVPPYIPLKKNCAPFAVNFSNPYPDATSVLWVFGDGDSSTTFSPEHVFNSAGYFNPIAYVTLPDGSIDTLVFSDTIWVVKPVTDFTIQPVSLCRTVEVSTWVNVPVLTALWDFGGATATGPFATHVYPNATATYLVSLQVTDTNQCSSYVSKSFSVSAAGELRSDVRRGCAGDTISFDPGNVNFQQYLWDFGDGTSSTLRNPQHVFQQKGVYWVTLTVTDITGCSRRYTMPYAVYIFKPEASFIMGSPWTNCSTIYYQFGNTSVNSSSWLWDFGDGSTSTLSSPRHFFTAPGYYTVTLTAYDNVCSSTVSMPNVVYVSRLVPDFSVSYSSLCEPVLAEFTDLSTDAVTWLWNFGDGDTSSAQHPVHIYSRQPTDSITLTVEDVNGCVKSMRKPSPQVTRADFSVSSTGGCAPFSVQFSDSSSNATNWHWDFGAGGVSSNLNPSLTLSLDGYYHASLIVTAPSGCTDTLRIDSLIEVNTPVASYTTTALSGCAPLPVTFTDNSLNAVVWSWDFGNGTFGNQPIGNANYQNGTYTPTLIITNKFNCQDTLSLDSIVARGPFPSFTINNPGGCAPVDIQFTNTSAGAVSYEWYFDDGTFELVPNPGNTVHTYTAGSHYMVFLKAYDSTGCSATDSVPVMVFDAPRPGFALDTKAGCAPLTIQLTDTSLYSDNLEWDMGDGTTIVGPLTQYTYAQPGIYRIRLIASNLNGCVDTLEMADSILVVARPQVDLTADVRAGCPPLSVQFNSLSTQLDQPRFLWDLGNGTSSSSQNPTLVYNSPGTYTVTLTVINQETCSDSMTQTGYITVFDTLPPPPVDLQRVTVEGSGEVLVEWPASAANDVDHYTVYRFNPSSTVFDSIGIVPGSGMAGLISYSDYNVQTDLRPYTYKVIAVDFCGYALSLLTALPHTTVHLQAQAGFQQVSLNWTPYGDCAVNSYLVVRKDQPNGIFLPIGTVSSATFSFTDTTAWCPLDYTYRIIAQGVCNVAGVESRSNDVIARPLSSIQDQYVDVLRTTVVNDHYVLTEWKAPAVLPQAVSHYEIQRSLDNLSFQVIATVPAGVYAYQDYSTDVDWNRYIYRVVVRNVCDINPIQGRPGASILLQWLEAGAGDILIWTKYFDWDSGVESYGVEMMNNQGQWVEQKRLPGSVTEWEIE
jgi:PKD repeat protein